MLRMERLYVLLALVAAASAYCNQQYTNLDQKEFDEWNMYKQDYRKQYKSLADDEYRMKIYFRNKCIIAEHNSRYERGLESFRTKINQFSDMTHQEYLKIGSGFKPKSRLMILPKYTNTIANIESI